MLQPVCRVAGRDHTAPGDAPECGRVLEQDHPGPARVELAGLEEKAEGPVGADPLPGDKLFSLPGPELPKGWEVFAKTAPLSVMTAAVVGSLWTSYKVDFNKI